MQFCYGDKNHIRVLEEAQFWKRQEAEHTVVIREMAGNLEEEFTEELKAKYENFSSTEATITQYIERLIRTNYMINSELEEKIIDLIEFTLCQSEMFVDFLSTMLKESPAVKNNVVVSVVVSHIMRESQYYVGVAKAYLAYMSYI
ncbi:DUF2935 domain-containing protein [Clostridium sp. D2Q-14]|uniref:DUF2935 domain-containing protein n=1 Tax=Anaeromonas gelatinilytica TaxID=2683194 RepID=UPI00193B2BAB|nr:DUF2935 domain-containing protein [Anaeromonas gelatinilytica]MBS4536403.1 DUF2935 domain-containing protein [Anaeromonas gelatinilytica]